MDFTGTDNFFRQTIQPYLGLEISLFLLAIVSLLLNGLLMQLTITRERARHALDTILLCIISGLDLLLSFVVIISQIWKWASNYTIVVDNSFWCHLNSILSWSISISALNIVALLSFVRYLVIVRGHKVRNSRWTGFAILIVILIFSLFIAKDITSKPMVFPSAMFCASVWSGPSFALSYFFVFAMILAVAPPLFIIPVCYCLVTSHYHQLIDNLTQIQKIQLPHHLRFKVQGFLVIVSAYIFVLSPEYIQALISIAFTIPLLSWLDSLVKMNFFSVSIVNALFALLFHEEIYAELRYFLDKHHLLSLGE